MNIKSQNHAVKVYDEEEISINIDNYGKRISDLERQMNRHIKYVNQTIIELKRTIRSVESLANRIRDMEYFME
jgi:hypothetical protein